MGWARPAFDVLQLEDYDWVTAGDAARTAAGVAEAGACLGYPVAEQHYLSGFVLRPEDRGQWAPIEASLGAARRRGVAAAFVWALPQVARDGFVRWDGEDEMQAFDDVQFPLALGREVEVAPGFSTAVLTGAGGAETRNAAWAEARTTYDVGPGIRSEADIAALLAFFRARLGPARGFRLRDPFDWAVADELLGVSAASTSAIGTCLVRVDRPYPPRFAARAAPSRRPSSRSARSRSIGSRPSPASVSRSASAISSASSRA
jgi:hypothetical protein